MLHKKVQFNSLYHTCAFTDMRTAQLIFIYLPKFFPSKHEIRFSDYISLIYLHDIFSVVRCCGGITVSCGLVPALSYSGTLLDCQHNSDISYKNQPAPLAVEFLFAGSIIALHFLNLLLLPHTPFVYRQLLMESDLPVRLYFFLNHFGSLLMVSTISFDLSFVGC